MRPSFQWDPVAARRYSAYGCLGAALLCAVLFWNQSLNLASNLTELRDEEVIEAQSSALPKIIGEDDSFKSQISNVDGGETLSERIIDPKGLVDEQFVSEAQDQSVVELMRVQKEQVILDFLALNDSAERYHWLRMNPDVITGANLVLFMGPFKSEKQMQKALETEQVKWPALMNPHQRKLLDFAGKLDDYYVASDVKDYSGSAPRQVKLTMLADSAPPLAEPKAKGLGSTGSTVKTEQSAANTPASPSNAPSTEPQLPAPADDRLFELIQSID